ncbi:MAG: extracellular solute-binding protein [Candidatus Paceibacterota bacterium]|jgi:ABC-type glycerol-3-phosphate transport system substrate-binding protein
MKNVSIFQLVLIAVFVVAAIGGLILFASYKGSSSGLNVPTAEVWGVIPTTQFSAIKTAFEKDKTFKINYTEKSSTAFYGDLIEALAAGIGPDLIIIPENLLSKLNSKIFEIPFASMSERTFRDTFLDEGGLFVTPTGITALPFSVDPLIMYWNRDTFASAGLAKPPAVWDEFIQLAQVLTNKDSNGNVFRSAVALGEFDNINNAKEILSALLIQIGAPPFVAINDSASANAVTTLNFYTQFSNPLGLTYSWNKSLPNSRDMFLAGDLAIYFGFASELANLRTKNPNLYFDVAVFPQPKSAKNSVTFGKLYGVAVLKSARDIANSVRIAGLLTSATAGGAMYQAGGLPPVRRDLLSVKPTDAYGALFYNAALMSRGWLDPDYYSTSSAFKEMVESVSSGKARPSEAVTRMEQEIGKLITK